MKIVFDEEALDDLRKIFAWITKDNPHAAANVITRIFNRIELLASPALTYMGHPGRDPGTLELIEAPYIVVYEVSRLHRKIIVLSIVHRAQDR